MNQRVGRLAAMLFVAASVASSLGNRAEAGTGPNPEFVGDGDNAPFGYAGDIVEVTFRNGRPSDAEIQNFASQQNFQLTERTGGRASTYHAFYFRIPSGTTPPARVRALRNHPLVRSISVAPLGKSAGPVPAPMAYVPNDPNFPSQWNLARIRAPQAWDAVSNVYTVGVMDSGVSGNSDVNVIGAMNFTTDPTAADGLGAYGHGTQMAGIAAARTHNGLQQAGVTGRDQYVYNLKVINSQNQILSPAWVTNALYWATDEGGVYILNMSFITGCTQALFDALQYAYDRGRVLIASTGNDNLNGFPGYCPAAHNTVIAVGGSNQDASDHRWSQVAGCPVDVVGSNWGSPGLDVVAPSINVYVTRTTNDSVNYLCVGTSGAAAHVSGLAALLAAEYCVCPAFIRAMLRKSADKTGGYSYMWNWGQSAEIGFGRINALRAVLENRGDDVLWYENWNGGSVRVLRSSGSQLVDAGSWISGLGRPDFASSADINGDGLIDMIWYEQANNGCIRWLRNTGTAFVDAGYLICGRGKPDLAFVADVNADGFDDYLSWEIANGQSIRVYLSTGTTLSDQGNWITGQGGPNWAGVADVNRDGKKDVLWYENWNNGTIKALLSTGNSLVDSPNWISGIGMPQWVGTGDVNRDGAEDVVWFHDWKDSGGLYAFLSTASSFTFSGVPWMTGAGPTPTWASTADANRDGRADIFWYTSSTSNIQAFTSTGGAFSNGGAWITGRGAPDWAGFGNATYQ